MYSTNFNGYREQKFRKVFLESSRFLRNFRQK